MQLGRQNTGEITSGIAVRVNVRGFLTLVLIPRERETISHTALRFSASWEKERTDMSPCSHFTGG